MKSTGIVRKIDELGRVVLPIELRRNLGIAEKDPVEIFVDDDKMYKLKQIINELDDLDKALLIVYADEGSMAKAGHKFNVSAATIYTNIKRIRQKIKEKL